MAIQNIRPEPGIKTYVDATVEEPTSDGRCYIRCGSCSHRNCDIEDAALLLKCPGCGSFPRADMLEVIVAWKKIRAIMDARIIEAESTLVPLMANRSEERRVGKECRSRWSPYH